MGKGTIGRPKNGKLRICVCGNEFYISLSRIKKEAKYCSKSCVIKPSNKKIKLKCPICSIEFQTFVCRLGRRVYCSNNCRKKSMIGKKQSKDLIIKRTVGQLGKKFLYKPRPYLAGKNNPMWRGGITSLRNRLYKSVQWKNWRDEIFERDNWKCQICGEKGYLEAHHIIEFCFLIDKNKIKNYEEGIKCDELWNIGNGVTLCKKCHNKTKLGNKTLEKVKSKYNHL